MPFSLVSRSEALIPVGIGEPSLRFAYEINKSNHEIMKFGSGRRTLRYEINSDGCTKAKD